MIVKEIIIIKGSEDIVLQMRLPNFLTLSIADILQEFGVSET
jgi:hypothetical protein